MFDINMQRAEACAHKISFSTVVLQPKGAYVVGGVVAQPIKSCRGLAEPTVC